MGTPQRPRLQRALGRRSGLVRRRYKTQPMDMQYVSIRETTLSEMMALKATSEPILIKESAMVKMAVAATALAGTCRRGCTRASQSLRGRPWSRAKAHVWREVDRL